MTAKKVVPVVPEAVTVTTSYKSVPLQWALKGLKHFWSFAGGAIIYALFTAIKAGKPLSGIAASLAAAATGAIINQYQGNFKPPPVTTTVDSGGKS